MSLNLKKLKKSAGVAVSASVHRLIRTGNVYRDRQEWGAAAAAYREALTQDPSLHHIHVQLGHILKEAGRYDEAALAYEAASALDPANPQPAVYLAHMFKQRGDVRAAARQFTRAVAAGSGDDPAMVELHALVEPIRPVDIATLYLAARHPGMPAGPPATTAGAMAALDHVLATLPASDDRDISTLHATRDILNQLGSIVAVPGDAAVGNVGIVFDVTDLIAHFRHHRLPTGIQRVQIEVVTRALRDPAVDVRVCCFISGRDELLTISNEDFLEIAMVSTADKDNDAPEWQLLMARLFLHLLLVDPFQFRTGDRLVNLGTSWWIYNYFLLVRNAKRDFGIRYITFVHDFIPVMASEHCVTGVIEDYLSWLVGVFDHADQYLVNSLSTGRDLGRVAARLGHSVDPAMIEVVPLDADFRQPADAGLPPSALGRWNLVDIDYCLIVSTIESRKNHILALDAWVRLLDAHGADAVPMLVCVGRSGWLNAAFFDRLARDPRLRRRVMVIERASDEELALLYRQCRFTLYPSHYEGWGLPVTESLCYGKVPVVADNSSLPEAGGEFALYFEDNSVPALIAALERILFEEGCRETLERAIADRFVPRPWSTVAGQVVRAVSQAAEPAQDVGVIPRARLGLYHPISLYKGTRIWRGLESGEMFRIGTGWHWPDPAGCRTMAQGGMLRIRVDVTDRPLRLYLLLQGLGSTHSGFVVSTGAEGGGETIASGSLAAAEQRWVLADLPAPAESGIVNLAIGGDTLEQVATTIGGVARRLDMGIGVAGFALVERDDEAARMAFVQGAVMAELNEVSAYAEPTEA